ncbi:MAG: hypothetical protein U0W24_08340 [Bacteroidales bacterium]
MKYLLILLTLITANFSFGQDIKKMPKYFGDSYRIDSANSIIIPIQYNSDLFSKWSFESYYADLILFNYKENKQKRIFNENTYIKPFIDRSYYYNRENEKLKIPNISQRSIFLFVKNIDFDNNNKINDTDPFVLYVCDLQGNNLKAITPISENAVSFELYESLNFILIRMQRDYNKDSQFTYKDKDFYYLKVDLEKFEVITKIELE